MKVLVIGSGGREHALAWQCAKFDSVEEVLLK
jgi:phosphoribosylamine--glycine ligase